MYIFTKEWIPLLGEKGNIYSALKIYIGAQNGGGKIIKYILTVGWGMNIKIGYYFSWWKL